MAQPTGHDARKHFRPFDTSKTPAQRRFMESAVKEVLMSGAFGGGKSLPGCEKGLFLSLRYPMNFGAIVRKTFTSLRNTTLQTWLNDVCLPEHKQSFNQTTNVYTLINNSQALFMGLDDPQKAGSLELGWCFVDEASELDEDDYLMLLGRIRLSRVPFRQMFLATNPSNTDHWLYKRFYDEGGRRFHYDEEVAAELAESGKGTPILNPRGQVVSYREAWVVEQIGDSNREVIESNSLQNPYLPQDYIQVLQSYDGVFRERYVLGHWIGFEGLVYEEYDPRRHVIEPFEIPRDWHRYQSIDFGYTNPFVCQYWVVHPKRERQQPTLDTCICGGGGVSKGDRNGLPSSNGKGGNTNTHTQECLDAQPVNCACPAPCHEESFYLYRELYMSERRVEQHASVMQRYHESIVTRFADHDAGDRAVLERHGFPTVPANKDIEAGIQTTKSLVAANKVYFFRNALVERDESLQRKPYQTIGEFGSYHWAKPATGKNDKEIPADINNHGMDAMRYFLHTLKFQQAGQRVGHKWSPSLVSVGTRNWGSYLERNRSWRRPG